VSSSTTRILVSLISLAVIAGGVYWRVKRTSTPQPPKLETTEELIAYLDNEARDIARKSYHIELDHSLDSIKKVDEVLGKLHDEYVKNNSTPGLRGLGTAFGAYVGEVIRRHHPGTRWERDHPKMGEKTYPLHWEGGESFPMGWCYKRIINGEEDNIWHKYIVLKESRAEKTPTKKD